MGTSPYSYNSWVDARRRRAMSTTPTGTITDPFSTSATQQAINNFQYGNPMSPTAEQAAAQQAAAKAAAEAYTQKAIAQYNQGYSGTNPYTPNTPTATASSTGQTYQNGSSTRTTPGTGDVMDGFARRYLPDQVDNLLSNPTIIAQDLLGGSGKGQLVGDSARYANAAPALYTLLTGGNMAAGVQDNDDIINYVAKLMTDMSQVGGATPSVQQMLSQLYAGLNDKDSSISAGLLNSDGTPTDSSAQVDYINKMIPLLGVFSNYNYSNAMQKQAARLGQEYLAAKAKGGMNNVSYSQYLQDNFLR